MIFDRNELLESKNLIVVWWFTEPLIKSNDFTCRFGIFDRLRKFRRKFLTKKKTTNMNRTEVGASETCNHLFYKLQDSPETRLVWGCFIHLFGDFHSSFICVPFDLIFQQFTIYFHYRLSKLFHWMLFTWYHLKILVKLATGSIWSSPNLNLIDGELMWTQWTFGFKVVEKYDKMLICLRLVCIRLQLDGNSFRKLCVSKHCEPRPQEPVEDKRFVFYFCMQRKADLFPSAVTQHRSLHSPNRTR